MANQFTLPQPAYDTYVQSAATVLATFDSTLAPLVQDFESWPSFDDSTGKITWTIARYRLLLNSTASSWFWINCSVPDPDFTVPGETALQVFVPRVLLPWQSDDAKLIFAPTIYQDDLYTQPSFSNCVWSYNSENGTVLWAWLDPSLSAQTQIKVRQLNAKAKRADQKVVCRVLPRPARANLTPVTFVLSATIGASVNPASWPSPPAAPILVAPAARSPPGTVSERYVFCSRQKRMNRSMIFCRCFFAPLM